MADYIPLAIIGATIALVAYCSVVYPLLLWILAKWMCRPWVEGAVRPPVTVIIPAHNEATIIARKIENILAAEYPAERLEVIVTSDCSTDATDSIVQSYAPRVRLMRAGRREGKQSCLNMAAAVATGEILVFTDAASLLPPDFLTHLAGHFADPSIGAASSVVRVHQGDPRTFAAPRRFRDGSATPSRRHEAAEGRYLGADCALRILQGQISSIVGCVGACYAMRRTCFLPYAPSDCDDFAAPYAVLASGQRTIMDPRVISYMLPARDLHVEFARKVRTIAGAIATGWRHRGRILKHAPLSVLWFFASHKMCRWLLPVFLLAAALAVTFGALFGHWQWRLVLAGIVAFAMTGLVAFRFDRSGNRLGILKPFGFVLVSISAGVFAWYKVLTGTQQVVWQPTPRLQLSNIPSSPTCSVAPEGTNLTAETMATEAKGSL